MDSNGPIGRDAWAQIIGGLKHPIGSNPLKVVLLLRITHAL